MANISENSSAAAKSNGPDEADMAQFTKTIAPAMGSIMQQSSKMGETAVKQMLSRLEQAQSR